MRTKVGYRILMIGLVAGLRLIASAGPARAQQYSINTPTENAMYCSGVVTNERVPDNLYLVSGENSYYKTTFQPGDLIFINSGQEQGVKAGDLFDVIRPITDMMSPTPWFRYQNALMRAMGTRYEDVGRLRVVRVDAKISTAVITMACGDMMQRGDIVRPFVARPAPQFHAVNLDPFAPPSGKKTAMVVSSKDYAVLAGPGRIVYINLGTAQGVRVGDYFRVFRYQGMHAETNYQLKDSAYKAYGFGSVPASYDGNNLPRQVLGEGIVLRTGPNSSTVMLTTVREEIFAGDYVEVE